MSNERNKEPESSDETPAPISIEKPKKTATKAQKEALALGRKLNQERRAAKKRELDEVKNDVDNKKTELHETKKKVSRAELEAIDSLIAKEKARRRDLKLAAIGRHSDSEESNESDESEEEEEEVVTPPPKKAKKAKKVIPAKSVKRKRVASESEDESSEEERPKKKTSPDNHIFSNIKWV